MPGTSEAKTGRIVSSAPTTASAATMDICNQCILYRELLKTVLGNLRDSQMVVSAMSTASNKQWDLDMRRASMFHLLHQAAVIKDVGPALPMAAFPRTKADRVGAVADRALSDLQKMQALPLSSYKWTWGEDLTEAEVLALCRTGTRPGNKPHSGNDISLRDGKLSGEYSLDHQHTLPASSESCDDVSDNVLLVPPPTSLPEQAYFANYGHLRYDPFGIPSTAPLQLSERQGEVQEQVEAKLLTPLTSGPVCDLADIWSSASDTGGVHHMSSHSPFPSLPGDWFSGSQGSAEERGSQSSPDHSSGPARSAPISSDPIAELADFWSSGGEEELESSGSPETTDGASRSAPIFSDSLDSALVPSAAIDELAEIWSSGSDHDEANPLGPAQNGADVSQSLHEHLIGETVAGEWSSASPEDSLLASASDHIVAGEWSSESEGSNSEDLPHGGEADMPEVQTSRCPGSIIYGPEHFSHLVDDMFDDDGEEDDNEDE